MTADDILARIRAVADPRAVVEAYGSSVYAPAHASDVDVLVSDDDPARLAAALGMELLPTTPPRLHGLLDGADVDVTIVNGETDVARRMRAGPRDAAALVAHLHAHGTYDAFQALWPHVRQFVRLRALGSNGLGWFGSFGWALLVAASNTSSAASWLRWLAALKPNTRVGLDGIAPDPDPFFLAAPTPPTRDVARLGKRAASTLFAEARAAALAIGDATTDADALSRIRDLADDPPTGTTLVVSGEDEHGRGRYEGSARGVLRELEALGPTRSWGRFDGAPDGSWQHRITVQRAAAARAIIEAGLAAMNVDAIVE